MDSDRQNSQDDSPIEKRAGLARRFDGLSAKPLISLALIVSAVLICFAIGIPELLRGWVSGLAIRNPSSQITTTQTMFQSIKTLGQLVTLRVEVAKAGIEIVTRYGAVNICRIGANHVAQGTIEGGVDLASITEENIRLDEETDTYFVTLPAARLTGCYIDPVTTQQYNTWGATIACPMDFDEMRRLASYVAVNEFRDDAIEGGFLNDAQQQAEVVISNFIRALTGKNVVIEFLPSGEVLPVSCNPNPPGIWQYEASSGLWFKP
ncbi:MAG: DUF4230 domain-containing protein [Chloroflexi bacterium]|nr:DUF4230 domain-containing protein [Chloroflexota bacterium]